MKVETMLTQPKPAPVPPLTLKVTFETEEEMQAYRRIIGPARDPLSVCFGVFERIGDHLEAHTGKRDNR